MSAPDPPSWLETLAKAMLANIPVVGSAFEVVFADVRARRVARAQEFLERISRVSDEREFIARLRSDPRLAQLFEAAVQSAIESVVEAKRRVLANAVSDATVDPMAIDQSELIVEALAQLEVQHVRALSKLSDEWDATQTQVTDLGHWGASEVWRALPKPIAAALIRTGTCEPSPSTYWYSSDNAHRVEGITDFGIDIVRQLRDEGWRG